MLSNLSALPPTVPTIDPSGAGLTHGPRHALERLHDAGGTAAAQACWDLWLTYGKSGESLRVPFAAVSESDPLDILGMHPTRVSQAAAHEAKGAGYILFSDLSVLVFQRSDRSSWGLPDKTNVFIEILPVVFRIAPIISTRSGNIRTHVLQKTDGLVLSCNRKGKKEGIDPLPVIEEQIAREAASWAAWVQYMPPLVEPGRSSIDLKGDWPAFFPREVRRDARLQAFESHVIKSVQSVMAWAPGNFLQAQVSAWSARPLQGGVEPLRIILNWQMAEHGLPYQTDALQSHINSLVFGSHTSWRMDDFPALKVFKGAPGAAYSSNCELFTHLLSPPISNHERLALRSVFPAPPPPPPLPGQPGYGAQALPAKL
jgi:hypothetical protein